MTRDLAMPLRWIEGHLSALDSREVACQHAIRAALTEADTTMHREELESVYRARADWRAVQSLIVTASSRRKERRWATS